MPNDATFEIMAGIQNQNTAAISFIAPPVYNIDDMDPRFCMVSLIFTGCFCLRSSKTIDPNRPGIIYIDGKATEAPLTPPLMPMFGQMIGIRCRRWLKEYDQTYHIRYADAFDTDGFPIPPFEFDLRTAARCEPGEKYPEHDALVLQAAREGAVLLKNDNQVLPLGEGRTVNVFGAAATVFRSGCLGAGKINPRYSIRVKEGIEKYTTLILNEELYEFYTREKNEMPDDSVLERAKILSDTAVIFISRCSSEAHDGLPEKGHYYLTDEERKLFQNVSKVFSKTVAVLNVAYPIETGWIEEYNIDAVLLTGLSGMAGGRALAEILEGSVNPSGKLPNTWAKDYWDYPSAYNFMTLPDVRKKYAGQDVKFLTTVYEEGLYVGYRYFDTFQKDAAYLFGHGLSYTTFDKELITCSASYIGAEVQVMVTNTGCRAGKEVVQLYARIPDGKLEQPDKRLIAFGKTKQLQPGESQTVELRADQNCFKSYDPEASAWVIESGTIQLLLGGAPDKAMWIGNVDVPRQITVSQVNHHIASPIPVRELSKFDPAGTYPAGTATAAFVDERLPHSATRRLCNKTEELPKPGHRITFPEVVKDPRLAENFVAQMTDYELCRFCVGGRTGWGPEDSGFAGMLFNEGVMEKYEIPSYYFADGNNGCNLFQPNIGFPVSATMCATWNEELMFREGEAIAREAKDMGLDCILAPAMNIQRNPLCGRHTEYFSEDPLLAGRMAGQESRGLESAGVSSCVKHFFGNNAETMRSQNHSILTERTAREIYLMAFETAFSVHQPDCVMTGYNAVNGMYCADDPVLLRGILRQELGFDGYIMTDWNGYGNLGFAALADAGISWIAPGGMEDELVQPMVGALQNHTLHRAQVQENAVRMVKVLIKNHALNGSL